jgi:hypothetical protein
MNSPHKDVFMNNPNILKCMIFKESILPKLKNPRFSNRPKFFKRDTNKAMHSMLSRDSKIYELLKELKRRDDTTMQAELMRSSKAPIRTVKSPQPNTIGLTMCYNTFDNQYGLTPNCLSLNYLLKNQNESFEKPFTSIDNLKMTRRRVLSPRYPQAQAFLKESNNFSMASQNLSTNESFAQMKNQLKEMSDAIRYERKGKYLVLHSVLRESRSKDSKQNSCHFNPQKVKKKSKTNATKKLRPKESNMILNLAELSRMKKSNQLLKRKFDKLFLIISK